MLDHHLRALVSELARSDPGRLGYLDPRRILFVVGAARLESRASIRPLTFGGSPPRFEDGAHVKPEIAIAGVTMLYEICLRPRFFLAATPDERLAILAHEMWHIAPAFDGSLDEGRRHSATPAKTIEREVNAIAAALAHSKAREILAFEGELEMSAWLSRPPSRLPKSSALRKKYDERDLYTAIIAQRG